jgi:hypothetical protein
LPNGVENDSELRIILLFERSELACELIVRQRQLTESDECAHDRDIRVDRAPTSEHARQHGNAMLGEGMGRMAATAPT